MPVQPADPLGVLGDLPTVTRYSERERDWEYMRWIKVRPCRLLGVDGAGECTGRGVQVAHVGEIGVRAKSHRSGDDTQTIPLCPDHHYDCDNRRGYFAGWPLLRLRDWADAAIADERDRYARYLAGRDLIPF